MVALSKLIFRRVYEYIEYSEVQNIALVFDSMIERISTLILTLDP